MRTRTSLLRHLAPFAFLGTVAVAVPAVLGYNILIRRNKAALEQARRFAIEVEARILTRA